MKWDELLSSLLIQGTTVLKYQQFVSYLKKFGTSDDFLQKHSFIIIDIDLNIIDGFGTQPISSKEVTDRLYSTVEFLRKIPTICINDLRLRRTMIKSEKQPCSITQQTMVSQDHDEKQSTPQDELNNPLDLQETSIVHIFKPFKNSKLLSALHHVANPNDSRYKTTMNASLSIVTQPNSTKHKSADSPTHLGQRSSSLSSASSDRPLADFLSDIRSLLVDDNPINRKVLSRMLSRMGMNPQVAQNGREACDMVTAANEEGKPINLIFMDIWMPEMNGLEAATKIRQELSISSVAPYIIAMTACVMPGDREKCINAGMNGYVSKPVRKEELEAALHTYTQIIMTNDPKEESNSDENLHTGQVYHDVPSVTITSDE